MVVKELNYLIERDPETRQTRRPALVKIKVGVVNRFIDYRTEGDELSLRTRIFAAFFGDSFAFEIILFCWYIWNLGAHQLV